MRKRSLTLGAATLALTLFAAACGSDGSSSSTPSDDPTTTVSETDLAGQKITLYSGRDEQLIAPLIEAFEAETGVEVEVRYGRSPEMAQALMEEGDRTNADVFYAQEVGSVGEVARAGLLAELPDDVVQLVDERFRPKGNNQWVGVTGRSRVIVYNPDLVDEIPEGVEDLTDPKYQGKVAWVPGNPGFQAFITAFRVSKGEEAAEKWLNDMKANGAVVYEGNTDVLNAVDAGDIPMGLINHYYWGRLVKERGGEDQVKAKLLFLKGDDPGALVNATAAGITRRAADNPAALALVKFLLSQEGQKRFVEETFEYPLVDGVEGPAGFPALEELEGPDLDLTDLDSLAATQELLTKVGLLS